MEGLRRGEERAGAAATVNVGKRVGDDSPRGK